MYQIFQPSTYGSIPRGGIPRGGIPRGGIPRGGIPRCGIPRGGINQKQSITKRLVRCILVWIHFTLPRNYPSPDPYTYCWWIGAIPPNPTPRGVTNPYAPPPPPLPET